MRSIYLALDHGWYDEGREGEREIEKTTECRYFAWLHTDMWTIYGCEFFFSSSLYSILQMPKMMCRMWACDVVGLFHHIITIFFSLYYWKMTNDGHRNRYTNAAGINDNKMYNDTHQNTFRCYIYIWIDRTKIDCKRLRVTKKWVNSKRKLYSWFVVVVVFSRIHESGDWSGEENVNKSSNSIVYWEE